MGVWRGSYSQCYCPHHIRCMNDLSAGRVFGTVSAQMLRRGT